MGIEGVGSKSSGSIVPEDSAPESPAPAPASGETTVESYSRHDAMSDFDAAVGPAMHDFAAHHSDADVTDDQIRYSKIENALQTPEARKALAHMNEGDVRNVLENEIHREWPNLDGEQTHELVNRLVRQVKENSRGEAIEGMRSAAVDTLNAAAKHLDEQGSAGDAKLLRKEAARLGNAGGDAVFRAMADHDVQAAFMKKAGIAPESLAGKQVRAAREQGKEDRESIEHMKVACTVVGAFATGGLGATGAVGAFVTSAASTAVMSGAGVYEKYEAIDSAKAGELAGTMKHGAVSDAKRNFVVSAGAAAAEGVGGAALAGKLSRPIDHALEHVLEEQLSKETIGALGHAVSHTVVTASVLAAESAASKERE